MKGTIKRYDNEWVIFYTEHIKTKIQLHPNQLDDKSLYEGKIVKFTVTAISYYNNDKLVEQVPYGFILSSNIT